VSLILCPFIELADIAVPAIRANTIWDDLKAHPILAAMVISLLLQPISAVGLWYERRWGFWTLLAAWVLGLVISPVAFSPLIMLAATWIRLSEAKIDRHGKAPPHQDAELPGEGPDK
jgi:O-antigen/teichoic acid export membrane protein